MFRRLWTKVQAHIKSNQPGWIILGRTPQTLRHIRRIELNGSGVSESSPGGRHSTRVFRPSRQKVLPPGHVGSRVKTMSSQQDRKASFLPFRTENPAGSQPSCSGFGNPSLSPESGPLTPTIQPQPVRYIHE